MESNHVSNNVNRKEQLVSSGNSKDKQDDALIDYSHPLDPLTGDEIALTRDILTREYGTDAKLRFKVMELGEPFKKELIPYLEAERKGESLPPKPARCVKVYFHRMDTHAFLKARVNLTDKKIDTVEELPPEIQGCIDATEYMEMVETTLKNSQVLEAVKKLELPDDVQIVAEPWPYGSEDGVDRRWFQIFMYVKLVDHPEANHYATPLPISPVFDYLTKELIRIDHIPQGADDKVGELIKWKRRAGCEYAADLTKDTFPLRTDLKPYIVSQPEGASFTVKGRKVEWQKWSFRVGYSHREGPNIHNVTYDGRNLFHRLSLSEMTIPYGDPRSPIHRKQAFDLGDAGFGFCANELSLGCDCLGVIKYFDGYVCNDKGDPQHLKNVICIHEVDQGIGWKHTNFRNGKCTVVRNRQLIVQTIATFANYEYMLAYIFDQAGSIHFEVRLTGILSTQPIDDDINWPWATRVAPGVAASVHQHLFCMRIDPAIDGHQNTLVYNDLEVLPEGPDNRYNVGYTTKETKVKKCGFVDTKVEAGRVFKIQNPNILNELTGKPIAYKLHALPTAMLIMPPSSINYKRAEFAKHAVWVTKYQDGELSAAGEFTNQSKTDSGLSKWAFREDNTENEDIVIWHTFGTSHNPRPEDFPVMPCEILSVSLKPDGFFTSNPSRDVPPSNQAFNQSTLADKSPAETCCSK